MASKTTAGFNMSDMVDKILPTMLCTSDIRAGFNGWFHQCNSCIRIVILSRQCTHITIAIAAQNRENKNKITIDGMLCHLALEMTD